MNTNGLRVFLVAACLAISWPVFASEPPRFTNKDLMDFTKDQRDAYYTGAVISAAHAIALYDQEKGQCFSNWFFENPQKRVTEIEEAVQKHPDHTPSSMILALPQLECGRLTDKEIE